MSSVVMTIITIVAGCLVCFAGYRFFRLSIALIGGVLGFIAGSFVYRCIPMFQGSPVAKIITIGLFTIAFVVGAFALYMKALVVVSTIAVGLWFYNDYEGFISLPTGNNKLVVILIGLAVGALIGFLVYYAQKWSISLFTAVLGAKIISSVMTPLLWGSFLSGQAASNFETLLFGASFTRDYALTAALVIVLLSGAGLAIQLKTAKR